MITKYKPAPSGTRFHRWIVLGDGQQHWNGHATWRCRCDCGVEKEVRADYVAKGQSRSCGCLQRENAKGPPIEHGYSDTPEYRAWSQMKVRCSKPNNPAWSNYGGRGITVCERWRESFEAFLADVGERPSSKHSLGRIDNDGHYEPGNVEWQTRKQQTANRRPLKPQVRMPVLTDDTWEWRGRIRSHRPGGY